jgi:glutathione S-transferase
MATNSRPAPTNAALPDGVPYAPEASELTLFLAPGSSSLAAHIALYEVGARFDTRVLSLARGDGREPEYLAINPSGKVPALLIDGRVLTEVAGILFYLARRFPLAGLLPDGDPEAEAQIVSWMSFLASSAHSAWRGGGEEAIPVYRLAEQRLAPSGWAVGDRFSIADIHLFRLFRRFHETSALSRADYPRLFAHLDRVRCARRWRPRQHLPDRQAATRIHLCCCFRHMITVEGGYEPVSGALAGRFGPARPNNMECHG